MMRPALVRLRGVVSARPYVARRRSAARTKSQDVPADRILERGTEMMIISMITLPRCCSTRVGRHIFLPGETSAIGFSSYRNGGDTSGLPEFGNCNRSLAPFAPETIPTQTTQKCTTRGTRLVPRASCQLSQSHHILWLYGLCRVSPRCPLSFMPSHCAPEATDSRRGLLWTSLV